MPPIAAGGIACILRLNTELLRKNQASMTN